MGPRRRAKASRLAYMKKEEARPRRELAPTDFLKKASPGRRIRVYQDQEIIYSQQSPADCVFFLQSGMVKLTMVAKAHRKIVMLALLRAGDVFGEACLEKQTHRMC